MILANALLPLQNMVDLALAGRLNDVNQLSILGVVSSCFLFITMPFNFLQFSTSGLSAQACVRPKKQELIAILIRNFAIVLSIVLFLFMAQKYILNTAIYYYQIATHNHALFADIFAIRLYSVLAQLLLFCCLGWFAGLGLGKYILIQQCVLTISNTLISVSFFYLLKMGVKGIVWGTTIAYYLSLLVSVYLILRHYKTYQSPLLLKLKSVFSLEKMKQIFKINSDLFIRSLLLCLCINWIQRLSNLQGAQIMAANTILLLLMSISAQALDGVSVAAESLLGQAIGANQKERGIIIIRQTALLGYAFAFIITVIYALGIGQYIRLMTTDLHLQNLMQHYSIWTVFLPLISVGSYLLDGYYFASTKAQYLRRAMLILAPSFLIISKLCIQIGDNHGLWLSVYVLFIGRTLLLLPNLYQKIFH